MTDLIAVAVIVIVVGAAVGYIIKSKKRGVKCIGCPSGGNCPSGGKGSGKCNCNEK